MTSALSAEERVKAVELATGGHGTRTLVVEPIISERRRQQGERHAVVAVPDRASGGSVVTAVDLGRGEVIGQHTTPAQFQLTAQEESQAAEFALADPGVADFLDGRPANPLTRLYFPPSERADRTHRFAIVFLRPTTDERRYAVVDLTEGNVAEVLGPEHLFTR